MRRRGLFFGIGALAVLWVADVIFVGYMLHYRPQCLHDEYLVSRSPRPLSGYTCRQRPEIVGAP